MASKLDPAILEKLSAPLNQGFRRLLVQRKNGGKVDVYYRHEGGGKKFRSKPEAKKFLETHKITNLTAQDNFSFDGKVILGGANEEIKYSRTEDDEKKIDQEKGEIIETNTESAILDLVKQSLDPGDPPETGVVAKASSDAGLFGQTPSRGQEAEPEVERQIVTAGAPLPRKLPRKSPFYSNSPNIAKRRKLNQKEGSEGGGRIGGDNLEDFVDQLVETDDPPHITTDTAATQIIDQSAEMLDVGMILDVGAEAECSAAFNLYLTEQQTQLYRVPLDRGFRREVIQYPSNYDVSYWHCPDGQIPSEKLRSNLEIQQFLLTHNFVDLDANEHFLFDGTLHVGHEREFIRKGNQPIVAAIKRKFPSAKNRKSAGGDREAESPESPSGGLEDKVDQPESQKVDQPAKRAEQEQEPESRADSSEVPTPPGLICEATPISTQEAMPLNRESQEIKGDRETESPESPIGGSKDKVVQPESSADSSEIPTPAGLICEATPTSADELSHKYLEAMPLKRKSQEIIGDVNGLTEEEMKLFSMPLDRGFVRVIREYASGRRELSYCYSPDAKTKSQKIRSRPAMHKFLSAQNMNDLDARKHFLFRSSILLGHENEIVCQRKQRLDKTLMKRKLTESPKNAKKRKLNEEESCAQENIGGSGLISEQILEYDEETGTLSHVSEEKTKLYEHVLLVPSVVVLRDVMCDARYQFYFDEHNMQHYAHISGKIHDTSAGNTTSFADFLAQNDELVGDDVVVKQIVNNMLDEVYDMEQKEHEAELADGENDEMIDDVCGKETKDSKELKEVKKLTRKKRVTVDTPVEEIELYQQPMKRGFTRLVVERVNACTSSPRPQAADVYYVYNDASGKKSKKLRSRPDVHKFMEANKIQGLESNIHFSFLRKVLGLDNEEFKPANEIHDTSAGNITTFDDFLVQNDELVGDDVVVKQIVNNMVDEVYDMEKKEHEAELAGGEVVKSVDEKMIDDVSRKETKGSKELKEKKLTGKKKVKVDIPVEEEMELYQQPMKRGFTRLVVERVNAFTSSPKPTAADVYYVYKDASGKQSKKLRSRPDVHKFMEANEIEGLESNIHFSFKQKVLGLDNEEFKPAPK